MNRRILSTVEELDSILRELDSVAETSDDELRRLFMTFSMEYPVNAKKTLIRTNIRLRNPRFTSAYQENLYSSK